MRDERGDPRGAGEHRHGGPADPGRAHNTYGNRPGTNLLESCQRAELYGGSFEAGPDDGGFRVLARIPLPPIAARPRTFVLRNRRKST